MAGKKLRSAGIAIIFILITLISVYFRIFYGWDSDESYNILLAQRISDGKIMFFDLWDLHQTGNLLSAVFCRMYNSIFHTTDGIAVFLRSISAIVQIIISIYTYFVINKFYGSLAAFTSGIMVANLLPRATQELEYSTIAVWSCLICSLLFLEMAKSGVRYGKMIIAAVIYSLAVFSYPTVIITLFFVIPLIIFVIAKSKEERFKSTLCFVFLCIFLAGLFFLYLLSRMSFSELLLNLKGISENGDHATMFAAFTSGERLIKSGIRLFITIFIALSISWGIKILFKKNISAFYIYIFITTIFVVLLNILNIRPSGPFGFLERYIGAVILSYPLVKKNEDKELIYIFGGFGIALFLGVLLGSNMGINENAMYLENNLILAVVLAVKGINDPNGKSDTFSMTAILVFIFGIVFTSGYFVRIDKTKPANVIQCKSVVTEGPLSGIYVFPEQKESLDRLGESIKEMTQEGKLYTLLTRDAILNYYVKGDYISAQYAASAQYYNEQWLDFYTGFGRPLPDAFLIDKREFDNIEGLRKKIFGEWILKNYQEDREISGRDFFYLKRR